ATHGVDGTYPDTWFLAAVGFPDYLGDFGQAKWGDGFECAAAYVNGIILVVNDGQEGLGNTRTVFGGNLLVLRQQGKSSQSGSGGAPHFGSRVLLYQSQ